MQVFNGSVEPCPTCFFPTYPGIEAINLAAYKLMDLSNKWVYFSGDVTVRQMYGEFAAIVHRAQVRRLILAKIWLRCFCIEGMPRPKP
jgi:hypothetical protein